MRTAEADLMLDLGEDAKWSLILIISSGVVGNLLGPDVPLAVNESVHHPVEGPQQVVQLPKVPPDLGARPGTPKLRNDPGVLFLTSFLLMFTHLLLFFTVSHFYLKQKK